MNPGATSDRIHDQIKELLSGTALQPGARLDPALIARELTSSTTPVREALNRLAGEGVVDTRTSSGFFVPLITEPGVHDLYGWAGDIVGMALRRMATPMATCGEIKPSSDFANRIAKLFAGIANASDNSEHHRAIAQANVRLHAVRQGEAALFSDHEQELDDIRAAATRGDIAAIRKLAKRYHGRRQRAAGDLVRLRYRVAR